MDSRGGGRGVFVLGAHRSGTSAVTRLTNLLGVPLCRDADLLPAGDGNVAGHWESRSLTRRNEQLLHLLAAAWDCPPAAGPEVSDRLRAQLRLGPARAAFARTYETDRWVWKDPRLCVLLPFWRAALPAQQVAVLVLRHPLEVAWSLAARNGLDRHHGLAIWERYLRHALIGCAGLPVLVVEQSAMVSEPRRFADRIRRFLAGHGFDPVPVRAAVAAAVDPALHHHVAPPRATGLSRQQRRLWQLLTSQVGNHRSFAPPDAGRETPGLDAYLAPRRSWWGWTAQGELVVNPAIGEVPEYSAEETGQSGSAASRR